MSKFLHTVSALLWTIGWAHSRDLTEAIISRDFKESGSTNFGTTHYKILCGMPSGTLMSSTMGSTKVDGSQSESFDIVTVAVHEIGHAVDLGHSNFPGAIMYYDYGDHGAVRSDDINRIKHLYSQP
ncbi:matrix metalloproteinase [Striga asiatica]|uniref:Matrix metalloproteinase n=1 Tax=Striga asiatica TaxID=4170 RepID=A0A5A7QW22_STRAF|nr:matrix metalloproteinase [Striga asiatica]